MLRPMFSNRTTSFWKAGLATTPVGADSTLRRAIRPQPPEILRRPSAIPSTTRSSGVVLAAIPPHRPRPATLILNTPCSVSLAKLVTVPVCSMSPRMEIAPDQSSTGTMLNPERLSPVDSVDFCGACHRTPVDVAAVHATAYGDLEYSAPAVPPGKESLLGRERRSPDYLHGLPRSA